MKTKIIKIGNSLGIRIPKLLLEQYHFKTEVELEQGANSLIMHPVKDRRRKNWNEQFKKMHQDKADRMLDESTAGSDTFDEQEWVW